jgi:hypothetical protein
MPPRWAWLLESALGVAVAAGLNRLVWRQDPGFRDWALNPYLLLVLLMALRYGAFAGFGAALLSGGTYLLVVGSAPAARPDGSGVELAVFPVALVVLGIMVGGFVQGLHEEGDSFKKKAKAAEGELERIRDEILNPKPSGVPVDARGIRELVPLAEVFGRIRDMRQMSPEAIYPAALDLLWLHFGVECAAIYIAEGEALVLRAWRDMNGAFPFPKSLSREEGLPGLAFSGRRVVTLLDKTGEGGGPFPVCGALQSPGLPVWGVVVIREIPIVRMNATLLRRLTSFLDWTASCLRSAQLSRSSVSGETPETRLLPRSYLTFTLELALRQARESNVRVGLLVFRIGDYPTLAPHERQRVLHTSEKILGGSIRSYDSLCDTGGLGEFAVLLVQPKEGCEEAILDRVRRGFREARESGLAVSQQLLSGARFVPPAPASVESLITEVKESLLPLEP